jgi:predicted PurR-regulated permease PerM
MKPGEGITLSDQQVDKAGVVEQQAHQERPGVDTQAVRSRPAGGSLMDGATRVGGIATSRFSLTASIYSALVLAFLTIVVWGFLVQLGPLLVLLYVSILVACGISAPVRWMERIGLGRAISILIVFAMVGAILAGVAWYAVPPLVGQTGTFIENVPDYVSRFEQLRNRWIALGEDYPVLVQLEGRVLEATNDLGAAATGFLIDLPSMIAKAVFGITSILTFAFLFLMTWERIKALLLSLIRPRHREITDQVLDEMGLRLGAYLRAKAIVMTIVGTWVYVTLLFLGSPYALLAAIIAALMEAIPRIGPWIGRAAIVLAVIPLGWKAVVIAVLSHVVIENIKGYGLSPLIEGSQVDIHPLTAFIAVIAGGLLLGWIGALVAVPTAAVIQVLVEQVLIPWRHRQIAAAEAASGSDKTP